GGGVRYRSGAVPNPPSWKYQPGDIRAFDKCERKVRIWELQAKSYLHPSEISLTLLTSLQGEAEAELEHADLKRIHSKDGVDYILEQLKSAFQQRDVYVKRQYLLDYETLSRHSSESLRAFCNRYQRCEASLQAIGIDVRKTYDTESRGSRLLDKCRLSPDQQRLVLSFDAIKATLLLQYPEYRAPPPVCFFREHNGKGGYFGNKGNGKRNFTSSSSAPAPPNNADGSSFTPGGWRKGSQKGKRVFQTQHDQPEGEPEDYPQASENQEFVDAREENEEDNLAAEDETYGEDNYEQEDDEGNLPDDDEYNQLAEVLTVTARKLASMTQGRKYSGNPRQSVEERKRHSTCSNLRNDHNKGAGKRGKGKGKSSSFRPRFNKEDDKKVFTVKHASGFDAVLEFAPDTPDDPSGETTDGKSYFVMVVHMADALERVCMATAHHSGTEALLQAARGFEPYKIFVAQPGGTEDEWLQLLEQVKKIFQNSSVKSMNVPDGHEIFRKVSTMIPWILTRVQLAVTPQMRRMPRDVEYTHRGGAIGYTDGTLTLEYECLSGVDFPKQKFEKPVGSAIFWFGYAEEEKTPGPDDTQDDPTLPVPGLKTDISFPAIDVRVPKEVRADVVWIRDLSGTNQPILGIVCLATNFQQVFGYPLVLELDRDGGFEGELKEHFEAAGTHVAYVPAEAHWRIGAVERRNAVLRGVAEKLIDQNGATSGDAIDYIRVTSVQAVNSAIGTKGRSPYQAVFGKVPRWPGDLLGDDRALVVGQPHLTTEELRCQRMRALIESKASTTIRRALLRKTAPSVEAAKAILPGSMAAYWRWARKAYGRKRGGYVLGRLLHHDEDQKSAWLHTGSTRWHTSNFEVPVDWRSGLHLETTSVCFVTEQFDLDKVFGKMSGDLGLTKTSLRNHRLNLDPKPSANHKQDSCRYSHLLFLKHQILKHYQPLSFDLTYYKLPRPLLPTERKAMDREIPWRVIMQGPCEHLNQYVEDECRKVVTDPVTKRIIPALNAYPDKLRGAGPGIKPKCRTVVLGDVSTAFLQGVRLAGTFPADLYEVLGNLYGFASAPRTWAKHVVSTLLRADFTQHRLDRMCFYKKDLDGRLMVILIVHVDDFLAAFRSDYNKKELENMFTWGTHGELTLDKPIEFRGKEINLIKEGNTYSVNITQRSFIRGRETTYNDLFTLYEAIAAVKATENLGILIGLIPLNKATLIIGYGDSSWANAPGGKSQMGVLLLLASPDATERITRASPVDWKSARSPRVTRSTSEANAMDECVDRGTYLNYFLTELLYDCQAK
ncbi:unnamed protein product, partial [Effrenium voratum]